MITYGKAIKSDAKTHAPQFVHRLLVMVRADGSLDVPFALCSSNLDGITRPELTAQDVTCPKCLKTLL